MKKIRFNRNRCEKRFFETEAEANKVANDLNTRSYNINLVSYLCTTCGLYHLTSKHNKTEDQLQRERLTNKILKDIDQAEELKRFYGF